MIFFLLFSECKETRRELHWCLFQMLLAQNQDFFTGDRRDYVYDCALLMYATHRLLPNGEKREFLLNTENLVSNGIEYCRTLIKDKVYCRE